MPGPRNRGHQRFIMEKERPANRLETTKKLWRELAQKKGLLFFTLFLAFCHSALGIAGPYFIGVALDRLIYDRGRGIAGFLLILFAIYLLYSLTGYFQNYWMIGISQETVYRMRSHVFDHLQGLPIAFFDKRQQGELMSRVTNDMDNISSTLNESVIQIFSSLLTLTGTVIVMLLLSPLLTAATLTVVPLLFFGMKWITDRTGAFYRKQQGYLGELNGFIEESISEQKIIKAYSREQTVLEHFWDKNEKLKEAGYWAQTYSGFIPKLMNLLNNLSFAIIAFFGGFLAFRGWISVGVMVTFTEYSRQFTRPLNDLANQFNALLSALAGAERVFEILDTPGEEEDEKKAVQIQEIRGDVLFDHVSFSYEKADQTIIDAHFHVKPGMMVALVGPTGAGKTTIINLLSRFYDPDEGAIYIDGMDIRNITRKSLRSQMGFVLQDTFLFEGTVRENIRYGRLDATDEEVERAAKLANAHSFIEKLPDGYETVLGPNTGISQGQKQLLAIARAVLRNPAILIFDEATSNIDTVTEIRIQEALRKLMRGRTTFMIAHRLNTINSADLILVLDKGRIIERGTHASLMAEKGFYYELYNKAKKITISQ